MCVIILYMYTYTYAQTQYAVEIVNLVKRTLPIVSAAAHSVGRRANKSGLDSDTKHLHYVSVETEHPYKPACVKHYQVSDALLLYYVCVTPFLPHSLTPVTSLNLSLTYPLANSPIHNLSHSFLPRVILHPLSHFTHSHTHTHTCTHPLT